jgi:hypothetical protein
MRHNCNNYLAMHRCAAVKNQMIDHFIVENEKNPMAKQAFANEETCWCGSTIENWYYPAVSTKPT